MDASISSDFSLGAVSLLAPGKPAAIVRPTVAGGGLRMEVVALRCVEAVSPTVVTVDGGRFRRQAPRADAIGAGFRGCHLSANPEHLAIGRAARVRQCIAEAVALGATTADVALVAECAGMPSAAHGPMTQAGECGELSGACAAGSSVFCG